MNLANFKLKIAAYVNRSATSFVSNGVDNLLEAINDARRNAQLRYDFNALKVDGYIGITSAGVDWSTGLFTAPTGSALPLKCVKEVWLCNVQDNNITRTDRLNIVGGQLDEKFNDPVARLIGTRLYVTGLGWPLSLLVRGVRWLPDLTDADTTDFFLDKGATWLTYQTIQNLNLYLKEDARVSLSDAVVQRAWIDLITWDGNLAVTNDSVLLE